MTARVIWIFRNNETPIAPRSATSAGAMAAARPVVLPPRGRAALPLLPPRGFHASPRGNLARSVLSERAPSFDATAERWIVPPSGMTPDAVAAADQRSSDVETRTLPSPAAIPSPDAAGRLELITDVFTTALGLTVFGLIAAAFLVMA